MEDEDFSAADLVLPSLADPDDPLDANSESRLGPRSVGLAEPVRVHAAQVGSL
jgi:hypothetical protein